MKIKLKHKKRIDFQLSNGLIWAITQKCKFLFCLYDFALKSTQKLLLFSSILIESIEN